MANTSLDRTSLPKKNYTVTSSFLNQLQTEWNDFLLEVSHSTPVVNLNITSASVSLLHDSIRKVIAASKNESIHSFGDNLVIPVPLNVLKRLLSPTKFQGDDASKIEIFNTIKKDSHLTNDASQKLRKLLFPNFELDISDWPSPDKTRHIRHSAPSRLHPSKKNRVINRIVDDGRAKAPVGDKGKPKSEIAETESKNAITKKPILKIQAPKNAPKNILIVEPERKNTNGNERREKQYSSVYELAISSNSTSLFYDAVKHSENGKDCKPTMVFTYFGQVELTKMYQIVKKLGYFRIENTVSSRTTHLICGTFKKTMNLCKAVARGCWILDKNWITMSEEENRWLMEERFEMSHLWPAIKENRLRRQEYGKFYRCGIFEDVGDMYISRSCTQPTVSDLQEVITLTGGSITNSLHKTKLVIGPVPKHKYVKEVWILNCVLSGFVIDTDKYVRDDA